MLGIPPTSPRASGFSLLELTVVVAVAGGLLAVAFPRLATFALHYRLEGATQNLALALQRVRLRAIAEGKCFQVTFDATAGTWQAGTKSGATPCGTSGFTNDGVAQKVDSAGRIAIASTANPVFDTRGGAETAAVITLTAPDSTVSLVAVNAAGRINVQ